MQEREKIVTGTMGAIHAPKQSRWTCYLFGNKPGSASGLIYHPIEGNVPNRFVRWMMKVCLGCTWVESP